MEHNHPAESIRRCKSCKATVRILCTCGYDDIRSPVIHGKGCKGIATERVDIGTFSADVANRQRERAAGTVV